MSIYAQYAALLDGVLDELVADGALPAGLERRGIAVEPPRDASHGDIDFRISEVIPVCLRFGGEHALAGEDQGIGSVGAQEQL